MRKLLVIILHLSLFPLVALTGQENKKVLSVNGYLSSLQSVMFDSIRGKVLYQNLLHNRINLKAFANEQFSFGLELRNRFFSGNMISETPRYAEMTGTDQGLFDLSFNLLEGKSYFLNSTIDRYWADFHKGKVGIRLGRQRINWGQSLVWNPNDIFNAYSVFDVDYEERPGCDALRVQVFPDPSSSLEFAVKGDAAGKLTAASLYRFNKWGYDMQFIAGYSHSHDFITGAGWSGAFGATSFRGEMTWFVPAGRYYGESGTILLTSGLDKIFADNSVIEAQLMYCNNPVSPAGFNSFYNGTLSARDLAFSHFSAFLSGSWAATPLVKLSLSGMALPDINGWFTAPSLDISLSENFDLSLIWQYFKGRMGGSGVRNNIVFVRIKYSF